jgi:large subunit ribosomal protein L29
MPFRRKEDKMELEKIRNLSDEELVSTGNNAAEQLFRLRFQKSLGNQEGVKKLRVLKLDIARTKTIARERAIAADQAAHPVVKNTAPAKSTRTERKQSAQKATKA